MTPPNTENREELELLWNLARLPKSEYLDETAIKERFNSLFHDILNQKCLEARRDEAIDILVDVQVRLMQLDSDKAKQRDLALDFVNAKLQSQKEEV